MQGPDFKNGSVDNVPEPDHVHFGNAGFPAFLKVQLSAKGHVLKGVENHFIRHAHCMIIRIFLNQQKGEHRQPGQRHTAAQGKVKIFSIVGGFRQL